MSISKAQWDQYIDVKSRLTELEWHHADAAKRLHEARTLIAAVEEQGIRYDSARGAIDFLGRVDPDDLF